jgi:hypothetical protein
MKKKVKFTPTERTKLIDKSSFERDKNNYQTVDERRESMREQYKEFIEEDPEHFGKREKTRKEHMQKTMAKLNKYGYTAEERPDGKYNVCSLETAGKCIVAATLGYGVLRALGVFKGQSGAKRTRKIKRKTKRTRTRKNFRSY